MLFRSLQAGTVRSAEALDNGAGERYKPIFHGLLDRGIYVAPSAYEVMFLSLAHTPAEVTRFAQGLGDVLAGK